MPYCHNIKKKPRFTSLRGWETSVIGHGIQNEASVVGNITVVAGHLTIGIVIEVIQGLFDAVGKNFGENAYHSHHTDHNIEPVPVLIQLLFSSFPRQSAFYSIYHLNRG